MKPCVCDEVCEYPGMTKYDREHFHCANCDCILTGYEVGVCCWCAT